MRTITLCGKPRLLLLLIAALLCFAVTAAAKPITGDSVQAAVFQAAEGHMANPAMSAAGCPKPSDSAADSIGTAEVWFRFRVADSAAAESIQVVYISDTASIYRYLAMYTLSKLYFVPDSATAGEWVYHKVVCRCDPTTVDPALEDAPIDRRRLVTIARAPDAPAELIHRPPPVYPPEATQAGRREVVRVWALLDVAGQVRIASIEKSSGDARVDQAALETSLESSYKPAIFDGRPVWWWISFKIEFKP